MGEEASRLTVGVEEDADLSAHLGVARAGFIKELIPGVGRVFLDGFEEDRPYLGWMDVHGTPRQNHLSNKQCDAGAHFVPKNAEALRFRDCGFAAQLAEQPGAGICPVSVSACARYAKHVGSLFDR